MTLLFPVIQVLSCIGMGVAFLRLLGVSREVSLGLQISAGFCAGLGILSWVLFPIGVMGLFGPVMLWFVLLVGLVGLYFFHPLPPFQTSGNHQLLFSVLVLVLLVSLSLDVVEALTPPADADTLAYHFAIPKLFGEAGKIEFIERAYDGAVPLMIQLTYVPMLVLGTETSLNLWAMLSSWMTGLALYFVSREYLNSSYSLVVTLLFLSMPAVIFGSGNGQIEVKLAGFVLISCWAVAKGVQAKNLSFLLLGGYLAGFYMGSKYFGLIFVLSVAVVVLLNCRVKWTALFLAACALAGFQWYLWNGIHTGDPIFPMFFAFLGWEDLNWWNQEFNAFMKDRVEVIEGGTSRNLYWYLAYPFVAVFNPLPAFDAERTGIGPYLALIAPFALIAVWRYRHRLISHPLMISAIIVFIFYTIWFFFGPSLRLRHLVPFMPLLLIFLTVAASKITHDRWIRLPMMTVILLCLGIHLSVQGIFSIKFFPNVFGHESDEAYLEKNVRMYLAAKWANRHLTKADRLFTTERQLFYYLNVPYFFGSPNSQIAVDVRISNTDAERLLRQLQALNITHMLLLPLQTRDREPTKYQKPLQVLHELACLRLLHRSLVRVQVSRTLPSLSQSAITADILKIDYEKCNKII